MAKKPARIDKRIEVILLDFDKHLGERFDIVKVRPIFARNILFPQSKAVLANANNRYAYATKMEKALLWKSTKINEYKTLFDTIAEKDGIEFVMKANEKGVLYEKIDSAHLVSKIKDEYNVEIPSHLFKFKKKISLLGDYTVPFVYRDLEKDLSVTIKAETATHTKKEQVTEEVIADAAAE